jgi:hypothetical protein
MSAKKKRDTPISYKLVQVNFIEFRKILPHSNLVVSQALCRVALKMSHNFLISSLCRLRCTS